VPLFKAPFYIGGVRVVVELVYELILDEMNEKALKKLEKTSKGIRRRKLIIYKCLSYYVGLNRSH